MRHTLYICGMVIRGLSLRSAWGGHGLERKTKKKRLLPAIRQNCTTFHPQMGKGGIVNLSKIWLRLPVEPASWSLTNPWIIAR